MINQDYKYTEFCDVKTHVLQEKSLFIYEQDTEDRSVYCCSELKANNPTVQFVGVVEYAGDKVELMGRTITPSKTEKKETAKVQEPNSEEISTELKFDFDSQTLKYSDLLDLIEADGGVTPYVIDYTKDGKYIYAIASVADGIGGYAGTYYREAKKGSSWKVLQAGHDFMNCSDIDAAKKKFMSDYKYIDDNLGYKFIGCYENGSVFPE